MSASLHTQIGLLRDLYQENKLQHRRQEILAHLEDVGAEPTELFIR